VAGKLQAAGEELEVVAAGGALYTLSPAVGEAQTALGKAPAAAVAAVPCTARLCLGC